MSLSNTKGCITKAITKITELIDAGVPSLPNEDDDLEILEKAVRTRKVQLKQFRLKIESMEKQQDKLWRLFEKLEATEKKTEKPVVEEYTEESSDALSNAEDAVTAMEMEIVEINDWIEKRTKNTTPDPQSLTMDQSSLLNSLFSNHNALFNSHNTSPQLMDQNANSQNSQSSLNGLSLPKPQLPKFNGNLCQWLTYWKSFKELVHNQNIGEAHKFQLLIDSLSGNALDGITEFRITKNYASAIAYLEERYGCEDTLINDLLNQLEKHRSRSEHINDQRNTLVKIKAICVQLIELGESEKNKTLMNQVITKFNKDIQEKVFTKREDIIDWNLNAMLKTLESVITISERVNSRVNANSETSEMQHNRFIPRNQAIARGRSNTFNTQQQKKFCMYCPRSDHNSQECPEVSNPADRRKFLISDNRCLNCGKKNHPVTECRNTVNCIKCNGRHHTSICDRNQSNAFHSGFKTGSSSNFTQIGKKRERNGNTTQTHMHSIVTKTTSDSSLQFGYLLSGCIEILNAETGTFEKATAAFDSMAETSFIHSRAIKRLKLKSPGEVTLDIHTFGSPTQPQTTNHQILDLQVRDQAGSIHKLTAAQHDTMINAIQRPTLCKEDQEFLKAEQITVENTSKFQSKRKVDILLGCDSMWSLIQEGFAIKQLPSGLHAIPTRFGYFLSGRRTARPTRTVQIHSIQCICSEAEQDDSTERKIEEMLSIENTGVVEFNGTSSEERNMVNAKVVEQFLASINRQDGRYYVSFPFKEQIHLLPTNKSIAWKRLTSVLDSYGRNDWAMEQYNTTFKDQLEKGIIEYVRNDPQIQPKCIHYLPHRPVITMSKDTTKFRIVFDASAHFKNSPSLNDMIHAGPTILPSIIGMLIRFRLNTNVLCSDVEKAFLQIKLNPEDRDAARFLWVKDHTKVAANDNLVELRLTVVPFGINASPALMGLTLSYHVKSIDDKGLAEEILSNAYVDNIIVFGNTASETVDKYHKLKAIFNDAQMNLREFSSNHSDVMNSIAEVDKAKNLSPKVLGIQWNSVDDTLKMQSSLPGKERTTKRTITQQHASTFDPLGWMTPLLLKSKLFLQKLWQTQAKWDVELPTETAKEWKQICADIKGFNKLIPRKVEIDLTQPVKLVVFSDASKEAHAACVYIANSTGSALLMARSKLKQSKSDPSIPKMEMHAAAIGSRLLETIYNEVKTTITLESIIILSDSQIALSWILHKEEKIHLLPYAERRRREMRKICDRLEEDSGITPLFGYINTDSNPADAGTRGLTKSELFDHFWWTGPEHIKFDLHSWPDECKLQALPKDSVDVTCAAVCVEKKAIFSIERHSSLRKAKRVMAFAIRFVNALHRRVCMRKSENANDRPVKDVILPPTITEIQKAMLSILKLHQQEADLSEDKQIIAKLDGYLDEDGLWRSRGRIGRSTLNDNAKFPIIIQSKSYLAQLIIREAHETVNMEKLHLATGHTMAEVRKNYWIPALRSMTKLVIRQCIPCQRYNKHPFRYPDMTQLPSSRVTKAYPFAVTGLDYMGPIFYCSKEKSTKEKSYCCLFTCATTRLIHLELVPDLTTTSFINAMRRFFSRRGTPKLIICDNASTFKLGKDILMDAIIPAQHSVEFNRFTIDQEIEWKNITPLSPWKGGFYERLVKSIKHSYYKAIRSRTLKYDELITILTEIEAMLNSRPLTYVDSEEGQVIRPIDFIQKDIILSPTIGQTEAEREDESYLPPAEAMTLKTRMETEKALWSSVVIVEKFWKLWHEQYITSLREHHNNLWKQGSTSSANPEVGMLVLVTQQTAPRNTWKVGRIEEKRSLREVVVKMPNGTKISRSINHLIPLEITNHDRLLPKQSNEENRDQPVEMEMSINRPRRKDRVDYSRFL